jgi:hypothetical protein
MIGRKYNLLHHRKQQLRHLKRFQRQTEAGFSMIFSSGRSGRGTWNVIEILCLLADWWWL